MRPFLASYPRWLGRYFLIERMASGGMGAVYVARHAEDMERLCAVKVLLPELRYDPEWLARFRDEARLAVSMCHPNVVSVHEVGDTGGEGFVAMELVAGRDVAKLLARAWRRQRALPVAGALFIACEVLRALEYCHRVTDHHGVPMGLVHRDISPGNVLVSFDGEVKITDFGLAVSTLRAVRTSPQVMLGKPGYIAPERLCGGPVDQRADLFNVGVLLFELLTCERYTASLDPRELLRELQQRGRRTASSIRSAVPEDLDQVLHRALAFDAAGRFGSAAAFREDLEPILRRVGPGYGPQQLGELVCRVFDAAAFRQRLRALLERSLPARVPRRRRFGPQTSVSTLTGSKV